MVVIDIQLSEELAEKARSSGLLTSEKIAELLEAELERQRQGAAGRMLDMMNSIRAAAADEFGVMTEAEFMQTVNDVVREVRAKSPKDNNTT